jgi:hypothetical protein
MTPFPSFPLAMAGWDWSPDGSEIVLATSAIPGLPSAPGVVIAKILRTTTVTSYAADVKVVGRLGTAAATQDQQPSWRP